VQEYRYVCRIGCGGVPMRVYNRAIGNGSWASVEDYLPAGNALGYNQNWRYRYSGGELLMMTASGEPSAYYPMDSNGLAVQNAPAQPCICAVVAPAQTAVCSLLEHGCGDDDEDCVTKCRRDGKTGRDFFKCLAKCLPIKIADKIIDDLLEKGCIKTFARCFGSHPSE